MENVLFAQAIITMYAVYNVEQQRDPVWKQDMQGFSDPALIHPCTTQWLCFDIPFVHFLLKLEQNIDQNLLCRNRQNHWVLRSTHCTKSSKQQYISKFWTVLKSIINYVHMADTNCHINNNVVGAFPPTEMQKKDWVTGGRL